MGSRRDEAGRRKSLSVLSETSSESSSSSSESSSSSSSLEEAIRIKWMEKRARERPKRAATLGGKRGAIPPRLSKPARRATRDDYDSDDASDATWKVTNCAGGASAAAGPAAGAFGRAASEWATSAAPPSSGCGSTPALAPTHLDVERQAQQAAEPAEARGRRESHPEAAPSPTAVIPLGSGADKVGVGPARARGSSSATDRKDQLWEWRKGQVLIVVLIVVASGIVVALLFVGLLVSPPT
jgi:hypothetical protein